MIPKIKITGFVIFAASFIIGFFQDEMSQSAFVAVGMVAGLMITAFGFYMESKKKKRDGSVERRIYYNGKFYTMDDDNNVHSAIYVESGIIMDLGDDDSIMKSHGEKTDMKIDLSGKAAVPGFNDSHMHLYSLGKSLEFVELRNAKSVEDMVEAGLASLSERVKVGSSCFYGRGWNQEKFADKRFPSRHDLDRISTDIPVVFTRVCGHVACVNSKALEYFNIDMDTVVEGGEVEKDERGSLTGILKENALSLLEGKEEGASVGEIMKVIENAQKKLLAFGITSVQTDDLQHPGGGWVNIVKAYVNLVKNKKLKLRVTEQCLFFKLENFRQFIERGVHGMDLENRFRIGPLKLLADGSLGARTALLEEEYSDDEGNFGISAYTEEQIYEFIDLAHKNGIPVAVHAIGDKMMDIVLDAIHKSREINEGVVLRDGIVHCQIMNENLFDKFREFKIGAYIQPVFTVNDWKIVESRVGPDRTEYSYNWKTFVEMGIKPSFGTDSPVESPNPLENIYAAVTRKDFDGFPEGGWKPEQRLTVSEAIKCYTVNSARMTGEEDKKGVLESGKYADFAVLSDDIFAMAQEKIKDVSVEMTVINGEIEYSANNTIC
ncbi:hypothetical protein SAMN02745751_01477 [Dethiosulfatibacter aminovorans DSM 17477]|uniref:Amidohydrolase 3 domain-containing protein n=1 Tax=Dethiosulfatibacter aminovorans DSM 17477 TaxID=1121476 RepID=A0A1M6FN80_9FIRM|nr:amidohydrolase [Dethiosulfatibacter aminovorans]SHI99125.1 hypothetical protein SAMN02745751_01477 [Dethiosulfatibacter aminovorans DSM 17477]